MHLEVRKEKKERKIGYVKDKTQNGKKEEK